MKKIVVEIIEIIKLKRSLKFNLKNEEGETIEGLLKDNADIVLRMCKEGDKILAIGKFVKFDNVEYFDIAKIEKYKEPENFKPQPLRNPQIDINALIEKFDELYNSVEDNDYKNILDSFFSKKVKEIFFESPAAKARHHNYKGGLLHHSIEVVEQSLQIAEYWGIENYDLFITAGFLHDIGKMKEYEVTIEGVDRTLWGRLVGHLPMSAIFISKMMPDEVDNEKEILLYHMILSHHGRKEWGSPVEPMTIEAEILHFADLLSSRMNGILLLPVKNSWTEKNLSGKMWYIK